MNMSQSYNKSCMFCKNEIVMSDRGAGKWLPYNLDGKLYTNVKPQAQAQALALALEPRR